MNKVATAKEGEEGNDSKSILKKYAVCSMDILLSKLKMQKLHIKQINQHHQVTLIFLLLHIASGWVKVRSHTEFQLPRLPLSVFKIFVVGLKLHHPEGGSGEPNFFLHISSSWVKIRLHTEF